MRRWNLSHYAISSCVTAALLAGCGGSQPPIGAPGARPQSLPIPATSSYKLLYRFHPRKDGKRPASGLLDVNGTLYGTTEYGGLGPGTVYSISTNGVHKVLYRFHGGADGYGPHSGLLDVNGMLYGTTESGGQPASGCAYYSSCGTVYSVSTSGAEKVLYAFKGGSDGAYPAANLIDVNGTLYGTTSLGGTGYRGTVFSVTTSGAEKVLHSFTGGSDGAQPLAELIDVKGVLFGTTFEGGMCKYDKGCGTVFTVTLAGAEKVLYTFQGGPQGGFPSSGLVDVNGMLYGTTRYGGHYNHHHDSLCIQNGGCGTVYRLSTKGAEKVLHSFTSGSDGAVPEADLVAVNGVLYGTTPQGGGTASLCLTGDGSCGTVYSITPDGTETVLYRFTGATDGWMPLAPLTNLNGTLYGTTYHGGKRDTFRHGYGLGTVFALKP
jgi:uncharacterized repeat protein (TIGR03803 family)